jgi:hypothetical protein
MRKYSLPVSLLLISCLSIPAAAADTFWLPLNTEVTNLAIAVLATLLIVGSLYAYASLARFAPYHSWIYLYLVSFAGIAWAAFIATTGGSLADVVFIVTSIAGVNLIVHVLRFDRVQIQTPGSAKAEGVPAEQKAEDNPLLFWNPPPF